MPDKDLKPNRNSNEDHLIDDNKNTLSDINQLSRIIESQKKQLEEYRELTKKHVEVMREQNNRIAELLRQIRQIEKNEQENIINKKVIETQKKELENTRKTLRDQDEIINNQNQKIIKLNELINNLQTPADFNQNETFIQEDKNETIQAAPRNWIDSTHVIINLKDVSLSYKPSLNSANSVKDLYLRAFKKKNKPEISFALSNINLSIHRGQVIGIVGRNGAGKSTLLKLLSKILVPSTGSIQISGKTSPLLAVGAGFHPELTGYENIYLYASILGNSINETRNLVPKITEYSELSDDTLNMPLRTFSAGMSARLAFSVAMVKQPEILLVDEVLAVGDLNFQKKCLATFAEYKNSGTTILVVTHNPAIVQQICNRAIWIEKGEIASDGDPNSVIDKYISFMSKSGVTK